MHGKLSTTAPRLRRLRLDLNPAEVRRFTLGTWAVVATLGLVFLGVGAGSLPLDATEARLGMAVNEPFGPLGRAFGGWDPASWPGPVLAGKLWAELEGPEAPGVVRWPAALATLGIGLLLARRSARMLGARAGVLTALCLFGSVGLMDRSTSFGIDAVAGLGIVAALDRILGRGSDWVAGLWAGLAFLCGGWPAVVAILLPIVVLGQPGATLSPKLLIPPVVTMAAWSIWALKAAPPEAWAAAISLPLTRNPAWWLPAQVVIAALPWAPFAVLAAWPGVRLGWGPRGGPLVRGWLKVAGACVLAGTLIPGLATSARLPALVGLLVVAAAGLERFWVGLGSTLPRRTFTGLALGLALIWSVASAAAGVFLAAAFPYYRPVAVALIILGPTTGVLAVAAAVERQTKLQITAVALVALGVKLVHIGIYAPEWDYRFGQGPWGRAIAQWVPPGFPIYTVHAWPPDLAFATGRPFRQLADPRLLNYEPRDVPQFLLLHPAEFDHWNQTAPPIRKVREFLGPYGEARVLARTKVRLAFESSDEE